MLAIGLREIAASYQFARDVALGKRNEAQAIRDLQTHHGMSKGSALVYVRNRAQMLKGEPYHRSMNIAATRYYLENIFSDEGGDALQAALTSVRMHVKNNKKAGNSHRPSILVLVDEIELQYSAENSKNSDNEWHEQVAQSYNLLAEARRKQLPPQGHKPGKIQTTITTFVRSPHVVAERLRIADGKCENCHKDAPFTRKKDGLPYLEVHHRWTLANGGDDTVENTIALCPNCHREAHHG